MNQTVKNESDTRPLLVTGANGYTGARILADLRADPRFSHLSIIGTYRSAQQLDATEFLDLADTASITTLCKRLNPQWIIHIAALPNQAQCNAHQDSAEIINVASVQALAAYAKDHYAHLLFLSSEAALDDSYYGKLKADAEIAVRSSGCSYVILQPAMIFGKSPNTTNDRPHNRLLRIAEQGSGSLDRDLSIFVTSITHLSEVIREVITRPILNETIPVLTAHATTRYDLGSAVFTGTSIQLTPQNLGVCKGPPALNESLLIELNLPQRRYDEVVEEVRAAVLRPYS